MIYNIVLVSGIQQSDSVIQIHIFFFRSFPPNSLLQNIALRSLFLLVIYFIYSSVYLFQAPNLFRLPQRVSPLVIINLFLKFVGLFLFFK